MELTHARSPGPWAALLWKDMQQIKSVVVAIVVGVAAIQLIGLMAAQLVTGETRNGIYGFIFAFTCIAPLVGVLGCSGMLVGHERQTGTWNWSSSLPIGWRQSLLSKLIATLLGTLAILLPLAIIPLSIWRVLGTDASASSGTVAISTIALCGLILLEVLVVFFTATLLLRETLSAMITAGVVATILHTLVAMFGVELVNKFWNFSPYDPRTLEIILTLCHFGGFVVVGVIAMVWAYRWRWGVGQQASLCPWRSSTSSLPPLAAQRSVRLGQQTSQWRMLLSLACRSSIVLRIAIVVGTLLLNLWLTRPGADLVSMAATLWLTATLLMGVTVFEGDQTRDRFRFLADRGASPSQLMWARLLPPLAMSLLMMLCCASLWLLRTHLPHSLATRQFVEFAGAIIALASAFLAGALSSLCFKNSTIAAVVAIVTAATAMVLGTLVGQLAPLLAIFSPRGALPWLIQHWIAWSLLTPLCLWLAIRYLVRPWLVMENARLHRHYAWVMPTALLTPLLLAATFGFLGTPRVEWPGLPGTEAPQNELRPPLDQVPDLLAFVDIGEAFDWTQLPRDADALPNLPAALEKLEQALREPGGGEVNMAPLSTAIEQLSEALSTEKVIGETGEYDWRLVSFIRDSALIARLAARRGDFELCKRAWSCNTMLQAVGGMATWYQATEARLATWLLWNGLSDAEILGLGGPAAIVGLLPPVDYDAQMALRSHRSSATAANRKFGYRSD